MFSIASEPSCHFYNSISKALICLWREADSGLLHDLTYPTFTACHYTKYPSVFHNGEWAYSQSRSTVLSFQSSMDQDLSIPFEIQVWIAPACLSIEQFFQMLQFDFTMLLAGLGIKLNPDASSRERCHRGRVQNQRVSSKMILYHWLAECQRIKV